MTAHKTAGGDENRWAVYPSSDGTFVSSPPVHTGLLTFHFASFEEAAADADRRSHAHRITNATHGNSA